MKNWALYYLRCLGCMSHLESSTFAARKEGEVWSGVLICCNSNCRIWYPIIRGIPRILPEALRAVMTRQFVHEHHEGLFARGLIGKPSSNYSDDLHELKQRTIQHFGFEWIEYARHGWDDPVYNIQHEEKVFRHKSLLKPEDIYGKFVLDAGCGNGRYTYWVAKYGGQVIGVDIGTGVESANQNTADLSNVQIIQGDIFNLPFENGCFDIIFSIGVLHHTGDARRAVMSLADKLKPGGSLTVHVYGKGNFIYEFVDRILRGRTTRMSVVEFQEFTRRAYVLRRMLERIRLTTLINRFVRLDSHPHCIFDWYGAPIATHHTYNEVKEWFTQSGLRVIATNEKVTGHKSAFKKLLSSLVYGSSTDTVTIRGVAIL
jgi:SAM-dependent methyltransferase